MFEHIRKAHTQTGSIHLGINFQFVHRHEEKNMHENLALCNCLAVDALPHRSETL